MIGRKLILGLAAFALCCALAPASAQAKACPARCKVETKACKKPGPTSGFYVGCKDITKRNLRNKCIKACKRNILSACKAAAKPDTCSPSGAFLDEISY